MAARPEWHYDIVYAPDRNAPSSARIETVSRLPSGTNIRRLPFSRRRADQLWFRARLPLPIDTFTGRSHAIYSPDFTCPPSLASPRFLTIHDLAYLLYPDLTPPALRRYLEPVVARQACTASIVLTVSEVSRRDVIGHLGIDPARVAVVSNGVANDFFDAPPLDAEQRGKLGISLPYVLTVGTIEPRKNHRTLFEAMRRIRRDIPHQLVVVGRPGWRGEEIIVDAADLATGERIRFLHDVDNAMLPSLYASAAATIYPSWYEGFGLPVLESLAAGLPTVVSTTSVDAVEPHQGTPERREQRRSRARLYSWNRAGLQAAEAIERGLA
jgi:glycosyltransferase involved in cell wall biosynthesis